MSARYAKQKPDLLRGVFAGILGGLAASWVMNQFLAGVSKATEALAEEKDQPKSEEQGEDSTIKVADAVANTFIGRHLSDDEKQKGGPIVHYAFGGLMGGVYGGIAEYSPASRMGFGSLFGSALFVGADEIAVPALGLGKTPAQQPMSDQVSHWAAHLVYGATVELVRRVVRSIL